MRLYLGILVASLFVSSSLTWGIRNLALKYNLVPAPDVNHHIHARPIPRIGGTAIFVTFSCFLAVFAGLIHFDLAANSLGRNIFRIVIPAILLFGVGLLDDLRPLRARTKLLIQVGGGVYLYYSGMHFPEFNLQIAGFSLGAAVSFITTVVWVVWLCNGINFIDGLDGLAAGTAFFLNAPVFAFALHLGLMGIALSAVVLAGALLGFLVFNSNPASIFLGDSGSLFIGFLLSGFSLALIRADNYGLRSTAILLVAFALPLFEVALSVFRRILSGRAVFSPDREHIHHQLLKMGFSHRKVVWILYGVSVNLTGFSLFLIYSSRFAGEAACVVFLILVYWGIRKLGYTEFEELPRLGCRVHLWRKDFSQSISVRKTTNLLRRAEDPIQILNVLETGLRGGFHGFDIVFDSPFSCACVDSMSEDGVISRYWNTADCGDSELRVDLGTRGVGHFGQIRFYWNRKTDLSPEVGLLSSALAKTLSCTLEPFLEIPNPGLVAVTGFEHGAMPVVSNEDEVIFAASLHEDLS